MTENIFNSEFLLAGTNKVVRNRSVLAALTNKQSNDDGNEVDLEVLPGAEDLVDDDELLLLDELQGLAPHHGEAQDL